MSETLDIDRIKAYCEKATAGPWMDDEHANEVVIEGYRTICKPVSTYVSLEKRDANRAFIANARTDLPAAVAELAELRRELAGLTQDYADSDRQIVALKAELDSLRAQLEQAKNDGYELTSFKAGYDDLKAQLDTARQEIERVKNQSFLCEKHRLPIGMNDATPICPWCERDTTERVKADRDKALRVAEEAQKELELISDQLCGVKIEGEVTHAMVYQFVEGQIDKQSDRADKAQSDLSTLRGLVDEMAEAGLPFKRLADVFDDVRYREQWPDHTRLNGSTPAALTNNTIALHNFLTLGDCRKLKAIVNKLDAARHTALKAGRV